MTEFLPWQTTFASQWLAQRERFAHAWLVHGAPGIGKTRFALAAAASLLCEAPQQHLACGTCPACRWFVRGNHPDLNRTRPQAVALAEGTAQEDDEAGTGDAPPAEAADGARSSAGSKRAPSREIRIEQIRAIESWANTGTHRGGLRVALVYPADALNHISANALLKVLEEPPPNTVFLLVSDTMDRLLPTLVSRCRRLPLPAPDPQAAMQWLAAQGLAGDEAQRQLAAAGGAPLMALARHEAGEPACPEWLSTLLEPLARGRATDVGGLVDRLEKTPAAEWIPVLQRLMVDVSLAQVGAAPRYYPELAAVIAAVGDKADRSHVAAHARWLAQQFRVANHPLNAKLFLHDALLRLAAALAPVSVPGPA